jgi:hypothetical protein
MSAFWCIALCFTFRWIIFYSCGHVAIGDEKLQKLGQCSGPTTKEGMDSYVKVWINFECIRNVRLNGKMQT